MKQVENSLKRLSIDTANKTDMFLYGDLPYIKQKKKYSFINPDHMPILEAFRMYDLELKKNFAYENYFKSFIDATLNLNKEIDNFLNNNPYQSKKF